MKTILKNLLIVITVLVLIALTVKYVIPKPKVPETTYTESQVKAKLIKQEEAIKSKFLQDKIISNDSIRIELGCIITHLQNSQRQLRDKSSKQSIIIKDLSDKLNKDNSIETCKALVKAQEKQIYNKQTEIDSLNKEADYWAMLQDSTEVALIYCKQLVKVKTEALDSTYNLLLYEQDNLSKLKAKYLLLENKYQKKKGSFWRGFGTGLGAAGVLYLSVKSGVIPNGQ